MSARSPDIQLSQSTNSAKSANVCQASWCLLSLWLSTYAAKFDCENITYFAITKLFLNLQKGNQKGNHHRKSYLNKRSLEEHLGERISTATREHIVLKARVVVPSPRCSEGGRGRFFPVTYIHTTKQAGGDERPKGYLGKSLYYVPKVLNTGVTDSRHSGNGPWVFFWWTMAFWKNFKLLTVSSIKNDLFII